jgi:sucrose synthase
MEGKPDLIIGNYTDGNLVASLMANKLGITQVTVHQLIDTITSILPLHFY